MNTLFTGISNELLKAPTFTSDVVPAKCDWVNKFRASGAEAQVDDIFGNGIGFIQEYWVYIVIVFVIGAALTLVFKKNMQKGAFIALITVCAVGFLLPSFIGLGGSLSAGPC